VRLFRALIFGAVICGLHIADAASAAAGETVVDDASYPEGVLWVGDDLYFAEMGRDRVMVLEGGRTRVFWKRRGCGPTAIARYGASNFVVLCHRSREVVEVTPLGEAVSSFQKDDSGTAFQNPNDATSDGAGGVFVSDSGTFRTNAPASGAIYHLDESGQIRQVAKGLRYANGVHFAKGGLFVSEHLARRVLRFPVNRDVGVILGTPEVIFEFPRAPTIRYAEAGPDGLELDRDGVLWVALYGESRLSAIDLARDRVGYLSVSMPFVTTVAFGPSGELAVAGPFENSVEPFPGEVQIIPAPQLQSRLVWE
jgi:sugar lactone lactonase YvrE